MAIVVEDNWWTRNRNKKNRYNRLLETPGMPDLRTQIHRYQAWALKDYIKRYVSNGKKCHPVEQYCTEERLFFNDCHSCPMLGYCTIVRVVS